MDTKYFSCVYELQCYDVLIGIFTLVTYQKLSGGKMLKCLNCVKNTWTLKNNLSSALKGIS